MENTSTIIYGCKYITFKYSTPYFDFLTTETFFFYSFDFPIKSTVRKNNNFVVTYFKITKFRLTLLKFTAHRMGIAAPFITLSGGHSVRPVSNSISKQILAGWVSIPGGYWDVSFGQFVQIGSETYRASYSKGTDRDITPCTVEIKIMWMFAFTPHVHRCKVATY
jgi:hypothetical protein